MQPLLSFGGSGCEVGVVTVEVLEAENVPAVEIDLPEQARRDWCDMGVALGFALLSGDAEVAPGQTLGEHLARRCVQQRSDTAGESGQDRCTAWT